AHSIKSHLDMLPPQLTSSEALRHVCDIVVLFVAFATSLRFLRFGIYPSKYLRYQQLPFCFLKQLNWHGA
ncbi:hypothetical protein, partial [Rhizobium hidalgonense]|uniref:hypothetical protein n=1 Tax=Rhizobium hidalgonense TaxID=1538159 RepID=UPI0019D41908